MVACSATPDKVDAVITYPDYTYKLSIKNYQTQSESNPDRDIQLHSGNLLRLIQQETNFINHFLNLTSSRESEGRSPVKELKGDFKKEQANLAQDIMRELILSRSLIGGMFSNQGETMQADYLVLNDSSNGYFYVVPMGAITEAGIMGNNKNIFKIFYNGSSTANRELSIKNKWQVNEKMSKINSYTMAYRRIRKMVISFAKVSVSAKMSAKQIKNLRGR